MSTTGKICLPIIVFCLYLNLQIGQLRIEWKLKSQQKVIDQLVKSSENELKLHEALGKAIVRQQELDGKQNDALTFLLSRSGKPVPAGR